MDWYQMAVFLYCAALTHFVGDFLTHWKKKKGIFLFIHCFLYALLFIPVFWWLEINLFWLLFVFGSHVVIDGQWKRLLSLVNLVLKEEGEKETTLVILTSGIDQVLHLSILLIIALFAF